MPREVGPWIAPRGGMRPSRCALSTAAAAAFAVAIQTAVTPSARAADPVPLVHSWQLVDKRHWQVTSPGSEAPAVTDAAEGTRGGCPEGMVQVEGRMLMPGSGEFDQVDALQRSTCTDWISRIFPERCARFDAERWSVLAAALPRQPTRFCIDRFEYPNRRGAYPWIMVNWDEAQALCADAGERLCSEAEWTFACEGEAATPYPYGYERDPEACVIDRAWRTVDAAAFSQRDSERALTELDGLWQGEPSGSRPRCRSSFGVYDMTGNVDEWTRSIVPRERPSILKGGYWGPVRARCRPSTRVHGEDFAYYQQGFRCCRDLP
jgi:formylglycine-generating enzyme